MKQIKDQAIVLSRIDYGEKDRILTLLCKNTGKISALAKSVRSEKSRLAGGIELLSESEISLIESRSEIYPLTSARLIKHFDNLPKHLKRMQIAFDHIKVIGKISDNGAGQEYYSLLLNSFTALNDQEYDPVVVDIWFKIQVLSLSGSAPR